MTTRRDFLKMLGIAVPVAALAAAAPALLHVAEAAAVVPADGLQDWNGPVIWIGRRRFGLVACEHFQRSDSIDVTSWGDDSRSHVQTHAPRELIVQLHGWQDLPDRRVLATVCIDGSMACDFPVALLDVRLSHRYDGRRITRAVLRCTDAATWRPVRACELA